MNTASTRTVSFRPDVLRSKDIYGMWFGISLALSFSLFTWGFDAYRLQQMHAFAPWLKFVAGLIPCVIVGGITGWLAIRVDKPLIAMFLWVFAVIIFAWLAVNLPLRLTPSLLNIIEPDLKSFLHYEYFEEFATRFGVAYFWLAIFAALAGLLEIPLSDSVFSTSFFGRIAPMLFVLVLMAIAGLSMDNLNNELLRAPVDTVNEAVQYTLDHQNEKIDPATTRRMHLASLRTVKNLLSPERKFIISGYDAQLDKVQVVGRFQDGWIECELFYGALMSCKQVGEAGGAH